MVTIVSRYACCQNGMAVQSFHLVGQEVSFGRPLADGRPLFHALHLEQKFIETQDLKPLTWLQFIDDIWMVWTHSEPILLKFLGELNKYHPSIKFTWNIHDSEATFLDVTAYKGPRFKQTGILDFRSHFKPTNKFQYVHH